MSLTDLFRDYDVLRSHVDGLPPRWSTLLSMKPEDARTEISDLLGVQSCPRTRELIDSASDLGLVVPRRKRERRKIEHWRLALAINRTQAMLFHYPSTDFLRFGCPVAEEYRRCVTELGGFYFHQHSGYVMWPFALLQARDGIRLSMETNSYRKITPFFDDQSGNYECWLDDDFFDVWFFNHENGTFKLVSSEGWSGWFDKKCQQAYSSTWDNK